MGFSSGQEEWGESAAIKKEGDQTNSNTSVFPLYILHIFKGILCSYSQQMKNSFSEARSLSVEDKALFSGRHEVLGDERI